MSWHPFEDGRSIGQRGSEKGIIVRDEEHLEGARVTLEQDGEAAPYAITCGIYGWMVHTRFFGGESEAQREFDSMRAGLTAILGKIPLATDPEVDTRTRLVVQALSDFVERFP